MSTVQSVFSRVIFRVDPVTKSGKKFKASGDGTAITATVTNGGLIRITSAGHGLATGDYCSITGIVGTVAANNTAGNPYWTVTRISSSQFDLQSSAFDSAWVSGGTVTGFLVGSVDGARFTRQRMLDIYNEARFILFNALRETKSPKELGEYVYGTATSTSTAFTAYSAPYTNIAKPSGFLKLISMTDSAATNKRIEVLPIGLLRDVRESVITSLTSSASNLLAFEIGDNWSIVGNVGTTPALITYYGITNWTWVTNILPNGTNESFRADVEYVLVEIAEALANGQSGADVLGLAKTLLNKRG